MGRLLKSLAAGLFLLGIMVGGLCFQSFAQTSDDDDIRNMRGPDRACLQCHKDHNELMLGAHKKATSPNSGDTVTCVNCHGNTSPEHRDGGKDVMVFAPKSTFPLDQRNGVCMSCHEVPDLRKALWAHDVHITRNLCTDCHQLHPANDPMKGISEKARIKLCVDCHGKLHQEKKAAGQGTP